MQSNVNIPRISLQAKLFLLILEIIDDEIGQFQGNFSCKCHGADEFVGSFHPLSETNDFSVEEFLIEGHARGFFIHFRPLTPDLFERLPFHKPLCGNLGTQCGKILHIGGISESLGCLLSSPCSFLAPYDPSAHFFGLSDDSFDVWEAFEALLSVYLHDLLSFPALQREFLTTLRTFPQRHSFSGRAGKGIQ